MESPRVSSDSSHAIEANADVLVTSAAHGLSSEIVHDVKVLLKPLPFGGVTLMLLVFIVLLLLLTM